MEEEQGRQPLLSMRTKIALAGLSFMLAMVVMLGLGLPCLVSVITGLAGDGSGHNESPEGETCIFLEGFEAKDSHWFWPDNRSRLSINFRGGRVYLNLTDEVDDQWLNRVCVDDCQEGRGCRWLYVGVEIRLRCSDDNSLTSNIGRGMRFWGLVDNHPGFPDNHLMFRSESPESDPGHAGFQVCSKVDRGAEKFVESVRGIDMREWHNYTILWRPGNATFLIDGEVVSSTGCVPSTPLAIAIHMENTRWGGEGDHYVTSGTYLSYLDLVENQSIEIDHIRVFMDSQDYEEYSTRISELITNISSLIEETDAAGLNTTLMRNDFASFQRDWNNAGYVHRETHNRMLAAMELAGQVEEIAGMFQEASEIINSAEGMDDRDLLILEAFYGKAEEAWNDYDYDRVRNMLETIAEWR